jgi:general secretion pathway protein C
MTTMADRIVSLGESRALAQGLTLLLVAVCVVLAARLVWLVVAGPTLPPPPVTAAERRASADQAGSIQGLFGPRAGPSQAAERAPASRSGLVLRGTVAAADATLGVAFIAEGEGATDRAYRAGESLPSGAHLREVHADRVLIERAGALETLALSRLGDTVARTSARPTRATQTPTGRGGAAAAAVEASGGFLTTPINVGRPDLATARQVRAPDLASLVADANIVPVLEGDQVIGVRLRLPDPALLDRLGLSAEDVITQVNGIPLDGPERRSELEQSLQRGGPVQLTVRRDGIDRQLTIGL